MDGEKENLRIVGVMEEDAGDKVRWRWMIHCGKPHRKQLKGKEEEGECLKNK